MWDLIVSVPDHCLSFYFPSFIVVVSCYKSSGSILNFDEPFLMDYTRWIPKNCYIPGLGAAVLCMLPFLPLVDKRTDFISGSQGSD